MYYFNENLEYFYNELFIINIILRQPMKRNNFFIHPLINQVVFPYREYQISLSSSQYNPQQYDNFIGFVTKLDQDNKGVDKIEGVSRYGTLMKIHKQSVSDYIVNQKMRVYKLNITGITFARFKIQKLTKKQNNFIANIQILNDDISKEIQISWAKQKKIQKLKSEIRTYYDCTMKLNQSDVKKLRLQGQKNINKILYNTISQMELPFIQKLQFLQLDDHDQKINYLMMNMAMKSQNLKGIKEMEQKVRNEITPKVKLSFPNNFKWDINNRKIDQTQKIKKRMAQKNLPGHVKEEIEKELENMDTNSQNKSVTIKYLDTLLDIPWNQSTEDCKDIKKAQKILNSQHTGLQKVKERILEFLAVRFRNGNSKGNILCLHGPPGVGKTSIAKSIAEALGRKFSRISLGGVTDQAQIRGHRRTYVAALPGVLIRTLIKAKSNNPVILLDQIQKLGRSYRGDPANALLQVLDPSQNFSFIDHYVALPFDLSKVFFICTANNIEQMSLPLLNRLQLIGIGGYTKQEKFNIAIKNIIPEQKKDNGVQQLIQFEDDAVKQIIKYSDEMGVRQMERDISKICRKIAYKGQKIMIDPSKVIQILGRRKQKKLWSGVGVVKGMAWTVFGGKVLIVEAIKSVGKGMIEVTGQLGDVMKQSVKIALSWIKSNYNLILMQSQQKEVINLHEALQQLQKINIHIHFPEGAVKKDGPSAGVTITTCLVSLLTGLQVKQKLAMTGEISLSGQVLPVGGIKQKCIAAISSGINQIIIPKDNLSDLDDIPNDYKQNIIFHAVTHLREVLLKALILPKDLMSKRPKF